MMTPREIVTHAVTNTWPTSTRHVKTVLSVSQSDKADVYCLAVDTCGSFALANGVIVSNCDALGYFIHNQYGIAKPSATTVQKLRV